LAPHQDSQDEEKSPDAPLSGDHPIVNAITSGNGNGKGKQEDKESTQQRTGAASGGSRGSGTQGRVSSGSRSTTPPQDHDLERAVQLPLPRELDERSRTLSSEVEDALDPSLGFTSLSTADTSAGHEMVDFGKRDYLPAMYAGSRLPGVAEVDTRLV